jgi:hypothetical protein
MKKILTIVFLALSFTALGQWPGGVPQRIGNKQNSVVANNVIGADSAYLQGGFADTSAANGGILKNFAYVQIRVGADYWMRNSTATRWVKLNTPGSSSTCEGLQYGGYVSWDTGLTFDVTAGAFCLAGVSYPGDAGSITLDAADPSLPRYDVIGWDTTGAIIKITGVPAADPAVPQVDPSYQLYLTSVLVAAGATTPTGVSSTVIWDENIGTPEYTLSASGLTVNGNNTSFPYRLTKSTDVGAFTAGDRIIYTGPFYEFSSYSEIKLFIRLKSALASTANITLKLKNGSTDITPPLILNSAVGFSKTIVGSYQNITIPFSSFSYFSLSLGFNSIEFNTQGSNSSGFYLDYITIGAGVANGGGSGGNYMEDIYRKAGTDSVFKKINGVWLFAHRDSIGITNYDSAFVRGTVVNDSTLTLFRKGGLSSQTFTILGKANSGGGSGGGGLADSAYFWTLNGNTGTDTATNFIGTKLGHNMPIAFGINGTRRGLLTSTDFSFGNLNGAINSTWSKIDSNSLWFNRNGSYQYRLTYGGMRPSGTAASSNFFTPMAGGSGTTLAGIATTQVNTVLINSGFVNSQYEALTLQSTKYVTGESMIFNNSYSSQPKRMIIYATEGTVAIAPSNEGSVILGGEHASVVTPSFFTVINTTKGSIPAPRMTNSQRDAITSPVAGLEVFNTTTNKPNWHDGTAWRVPLDSTNGHWLKVGTDIYYTGGDVLVGTDTSASLFTVAVNGLGVTDVDSNRVLITNNTPAALGAQQYAPALVLRGHGWGTTASTSQNVEWRFKQGITQGGTPTTWLDIEARTGTGAWARKLYLDQSSNLNITGTFNSGTIVSSGQGVFANLITVTRTVAAVSGTIGGNLISGGVATAGVPVQYSPFTASSGTAWNTTSSASNTVGFYGEVRPVSGATVSGNFTWYRQVAGGSLVDLMSLNTDGTLNVLTKQVIGSTASAHASKLLDLRSTDSGLGIMKMTATQASAIATPDDGVMVYVTDTNGTFTAVGFWGVVAGTWTKMHL